MIILKIKSKIMRVEKIMKHFKLDITFLFYLFNASLKIFHYFIWVGEFVLFLHT